MICASPFDFPPSLHEGEFGGRIVLAARAGVQTLDRRSHNFKGGGKDGRHRYTQDAYSHWVLCRKKERKVQGDSAP